jgi:hypothetical protein
MIILNKGKFMFDYMLQMEDVDPAHLAIDKPSEKSVKFLKKHYQLKNPISQVNSFVVFEGFFTNRTNQNVFVKRRHLNNKNTQFSSQESLMMPNNNRKYSAESSSLNRTDSMLQMGVRKLFLIFFIKFYSNFYSQ